MRPSSAFDLRKVALAERLIHFFADGTNQLALGHRASHAAKRAFHLAQVPDFVTKFHDVRLLIAICNQDIAICDETSSVKYYADSNGFMDYSIGVCRSV